MDSGVHTARPTEPAQILDDSIRQSNAEIKLAAATAEEELRSNLRIGEGKAASVALGRFAEKLFALIQTRIARAASDAPNYVLALELLSAFVRQETIRVYTGVSSAELSSGWLAVLQSRLEELIRACAPKTAVLFSSELGLIVGPDQILEMTYDFNNSSNSGIEVRPKHLIEGPLPVLIKRRIREIGLNGTIGLAKKAGYSRHVIYKLLGGRSVSSKAVMHIAQALDVPLPEFAELVRETRARRELADKPSETGSRRGKSRHISK